MSNRVPSPLDRLTEPSRLTARVVDPGLPVRVHGYGVESDLAAHYGFAAVAALCLRGELASPEAARALETALVFLAPVTVAQAPGHVGLLSRVCGVRWPVTLGLCALALAEEAAAVVEAHGEWISWIARTGPEASAPPASALGGDEQDRESVDRLRTLLEAIPFDVPALSVGPNRTAALLAVLARCGLGEEAMQTAWLMARLPAAAAEAAARPLLNVRDYPFNLPPLEYREGE